MPYTAHHMLVVTMLSIEILRPLLPENAKEYAFWRSWLCLVEIVSALVTPTFTWSSLEALQQTLVDWHTSFDAVPQYAGFWVPKFHWAMHLALDIWKFGPPRLNWCFQYEGKNQPLKRGCKRSNYHNPAKSTAEFWCESSDYELRSRKKQKCETLRVTASGPISAFPKRSIELTAILSELDLHPDVTFHFLESVVIQKQHVTAGSYAQIDVDGTWYVAKMNHLIAVDGHVVLCAYLYPAELNQRRDQYGVLAITWEELEIAKATDYLVLSAETHNVNAMWHFRSRSGGRNSVVTFVPKW